MTNRKRFDAVKMMRSIRDGLSKELINMDYTEQKNYIVQALKRKPLKHKAKGMSLTCRPCQLEHKAVSPPVYPACCRRVSKRQIRLLHMRYAILHHLPGFMIQKTR